MTFAPSVDVLIVVGRDYFSVGIGLIIAWHTCLISKRLQTYICLICKIDLTAIYGILSAREGVSWVEKRKKPRKDEKRTILCHDLNGLYAVSLHRLCFATKKKNR